MNQFVYLDNNATTKLSKKVFASVKNIPLLQFGNPSSSHFFGKKARELVEDARASVASFISAKPEQIVFTSGGSEGNCSAIFSALMKFPEKKKIVTTKIEHASILEYCKLMEKIGYETSYIDVDEIGRINLEALKKEIDENTAIVSIACANNETGVIAHFFEIKQIIAEKKKQFNFVFHTDAVQALGKIHFNATSLQVDVATFSGHKIHAPKGCGFIYIKEPKNFVPLISGHQENGLRGGTENVAGIVAMGKCCEIMKENFEKSLEKLHKLQMFLEKKLSKVSGVNVNFKEAMFRLPNTTSITFDKFDGNKMLFALEKQGICVSTGSACNSASAEPSHVLRAMKVNKPENTIRISTSEETTRNQINYFVLMVENILGGK